MIAPAKLFIPIVALILAGFISVREYRSACGPQQPVGEAHGKEHGVEDGAHASPGFLAEVCEEGLITVFKEKIGLGGPAMVVKAEPKTAKADHAADGKHDHNDAPKGDEAKDEHGHGASGHTEGGEGEGLVKLTPAQMEALGIDMAPAASGTLIKEIAVPGRISINANAQARVVPKLPGTVAKVMKQIGDSVIEGDILATLESREMADAKGEFLAARRSEELAMSTFAREERLWKQKVTAEQDYLNAKNAHQEAVIKRDLSHQRLHTIGMPEEEISAFAESNNEEAYRFYDLKSPIKGSVIARDIVMGQIVGTDREAFSIADLTTVWVEMSVSPADLPFAKEGQAVRIQSAGKSATAKVIAVSLAIDPETRAAKVIAGLDNTASEWRVGDFVNAQLLAAKQDVDLMVPREAIQTIKGAKAVFVNEGGGFRMRPVTTGREDTSNVEVLSGLEFGETIATKNTFTLKAELGKAEAEHEH